MGEVGRQAGPLQLVLAAQRIRARALRRPLGDHEQVRGKAPRRVRLEHVVLEDVVPRVLPVVRDLAGVVVAHDVDAAVLTAPGVGQVRATLLGTLGLRHEPVHLPPVDVQGRVDHGVGPTPIQVVAIVIGPIACLAVGIGDADSRRDAVRTRVRPEVGIEGAVLLHDHDHVLDLVDPAQPAPSTRARGRRSRRRRARHGHAADRPDDGDAGKGPGNDSSHPPRRGGSGRPRAAAHAKKLMSTLMEGLHITRPPGVGRHSCCIAQVLSADVPAVKKRLQFVRIR